MLPLVICILSVTLASKSEIRGWLTSGKNFRWIRTSAAPNPQPNRPLLQYLLTQTIGILAVIFLFYQVKLAIPKVFNGKITPHLSVVPLAIYLLRLTSCLITPQGVEEFLYSFTQCELKGSLGALHLGASRLTHKCPRLCQGTLRAGAFKEPYLGSEIWPRAEGWIQKCLTGYFPAYYPILSTIIGRPNDASILFCLPL